MEEEEDSVPSSQRYDEDVPPARSLSDSSLLSLSDQASRDDGRCVVAVSNLSQKNDFQSMVPAHIIDHASKIMIKRGSSHDNARYAALMDFKAPLKTGGAWRERAQSEGRCEKESSFESRNSNKTCIEDMKASIDSSGARSDARRRTVSRQRLPELSRRLDQERTSVPQPKQKTPSNCGYLPRQRFNSAGFADAVLTKKKGLDERDTSASVSIRTKRKPKTNVTYCEADLDGVCAAHRAQGETNDSHIGCSSCAHCKLSKTPGTEPLIGFTGKYERHTLSPEVQNLLHSPVRQGGLRKNDAHKAAHRHLTTPTSQSPLTRGKSMTPSQSRLPLPHKVTSPDANEERMREEKRWLVDQILFRLSPQFQKHHAGQNPEDDNSNPEQSGSNLDVTTSDEVNNVQQEAMKTHQKVRTQSLSPERLKSGFGGLLTRQPMKLSHSQQQEVSSNRSLSVDSKPNIHKGHRDRGFSQSPCADNVAIGRTRGQKSPTMKVKYVAPSPCFASAKVSNAKIAKKAMLQCLPSNKEGEKKCLNQNSVFSHVTRQKLLKNQEEGNSSNLKRVDVKLNLSQSKGSGATQRKLILTSPTSPKGASKTLLREMQRCHRCADDSNTAKKIEKQMKSEQIKKDQITPAKEEIYPKTPLATCTRDYNLPSEKMDVLDNIGAERKEMDDEIRKDKEVERRLQYQGKESQIECVESRGSYPFQGAPQGKENETARLLVKASAILLERCKKGQESQEAREPEDEKEEVKVKTEAMSSATKNAKNFLMEAEKLKIMQSMKEHFIRRRNHWFKMKNLRTETNKQRLEHEEDMPSQPKRTEPLSAAVNCGNSQEEESREFIQKGLELKESLESSQASVTELTNVQVSADFSVSYKTSKQEDNSCRVSSFARETKDLEKETRVSNNRGVVGVSRKEGQTCVANSQRVGEISEEEERRVINKQTVSQISEEKERHGINKQKVGEISEKGGERMVYKCQKYRHALPSPIRGTTDLEAETRVSQKSTEKGISYSSISKNNIVQRENCTLTSTSGFGGIEKASEGSEERVQVDGDAITVFSEAMTDEIKDRAFKFQHIRKLFESSLKFKPCGAMQEHSPLTENPAIHETRPKKNFVSIPVNSTKTKASCNNKPERNGDFRYDTTKNTPPVSKQPLSLVRRRSLSSGEGCTSFTESLRIWKLKSKSVTKLNQAVDKKKAESSPTSRGKFINKPSAIQNLLNELKNHILLERVSRSRSNRSYDNSDTDIGVTFSNTGPTEISKEAENRPMTSNISTKPIPKEPTSDTIKEISLDSVIETHPGAKSSPPCYPVPQSVSEISDSQPHSHTTIVLVSGDKLPSSFGSGTPFDHQVYQFRLPATSNVQQQQDVSKWQNQKLTAELKSHLISLIRDCDSECVFQEDQQPQPLTDGPGMSVFQVGKTHEKGSYQGIRPVNKDSTEPRASIKSSHLQPTDTSRHGSSFSPNLPVLHEYNNESQLNRIQNHVRHLSSSDVNWPTSMVQIERENVDSFSPYLKTQARNASISKPEADLPLFKTPCNLVSKFPWQTWKDENKSSEEEMKNHAPSDATLEEYLEMKLDERKNQQPNSSFSTLGKSGRLERLAPENIQQLLSQKKISPIMQSNDLHYIDGHVFTLACDDKNNIVRKGNQSSLSLLEQDSIALPERDTSTVSRDDNLLHFKKNTTPMGSNISMLSANDKDNLLYLLNNQSLLSNTDSNKYLHSTSKLSASSCNDKDDILRQKGNLSPQACKERYTSPNSKTKISCDSRDSLLEAKPNISRYSGNENVPNLQSKQFSGEDIKIILHLKKNPSTASCNDKYTCGSVSQSNESLQSKINYSPPNQYEHLKTRLKKMYGVQPCLLSDMPSCKTDFASHDSEKKSYQPDFTSFKADTLSHRPVGLPYQPEFAHAVTEDPSWKSNIKSSKVDIPACKVASPPYQYDQHGPPSYTSDFSKTDLPPHRQDAGIHSYEADIQTYRPDPQSFEADIPACRPDPPSHETDLRSYGVDLLSQRSDPASHLLERPYFTADAIYKSDLPSYQPYDAVCQCPDKMPSPRAKFDYTPEKSEAHLDDIKCLVTDGMSHHQPFGFSTGTTILCPTDMPEASYRLCEWMKTEAQTATHACKSKYEQDLKDTNLVNQSTKLEEAHKNKEEISNILLGASSIGSVYDESLSYKQRELSTGPPFPRKYISYLHNLSPPGWQPVSGQQVQYPSPESGIQDIGSDHMSCSQTESMFAQRSPKQTNSQARKEVPQKQRTRDSSPPHASVKQLSFPVSPLSQGVSPPHLSRDQRSTYETLGHTVAEIGHKVTPDRYTVAENTPDWSKYQSERLQLNLEPKPCCAPTSTLSTHTNEFYTDSGDITSKIGRHCLHDEHADHRTEDYSVTNGKKNVSMKSFADLIRDNEIYRPLPAWNRHNPQTWSQNLPHLHSFGCQPHYESNNTTQNKKECSFQDSNQDSGSQCDFETTLKRFSVSDQEIPLDLSKKSKQDAFSTVSYSTESPLNLCIRPFRDDSVLALYQDTSTNQSVSLSRIKSSSAIDLTTQSSSIGKNSSNILEPESRGSCETSHDNDGLMDIYENTPHHDGWAARYFNSGHPSKSPGWTMLSSNQAHESKMVRPGFLNITSSQMRGKSSNDQNSRRLSGEPPNSTNSDMQRPNPTQVSCDIRNPYWSDGSDSKQIKSNVCGHISNIIDDPQQGKQIPHDLWPGLSTCNPECTKEPQPMLSDQENLRLSTLSNRVSESGNLSQESLKIHSQVEFCHTQKIPISCVVEKEANVDVEVSDNTVLCHVDVSQVPHFPAQNKPLIPLTSEKCQGPEMDETSHSHETESDFNRKPITSYGFGSPLKSTLGQSIGTLDLQAVDISTLTSPASSKSSFSDVTVISSPPYHARCSPPATGYFAQPGKKSTPGGRRDTKENSDVCGTQSWEKTESVSQGDSFHSCCSRLSS